MCLLMQGEEVAVSAALRIMCDAIARYKELCEGSYAGAQILWGSLRHITAQPMMMALAA